MLLARKKLTLDECIEECRSAQDTSQRVEVMRRGAEEKGLREAQGSADNVFAVRQRSDMCGKITEARRCNRPGETCLSVLWRGTSMGSGTLPSVWKKVLLVHGKESFREGM